MTIEVHANPMPKKIPKHRMRAAFAIQSSNIGTVIVSPRDTRVLPLPLGAAKQVLNNEIKNNNNNEVDDEQNEKNFDHI
jgi:hypothetical protein